ncbi:hypothetical protein [Neobacillus niacini]|uniref:hypothetical protein n=1 Tax=Neobacillus niacini TaxID=86668 RepID=UPI003983733D
MTESENKKEEFIQPQAAEQKELSKENIMNLVNKLSSNPGTIDLASVMGMANTLLKNDSIFSTLQGLGNKLEPNLTAKEEPKQENMELESIREHLETLINEVQALKLEMMEAKSMLKGLRKKTNTSKRRIKRKK